jgi:hypothetical protein
VFSLEKKDAPRVEHRVSAPLNGHITAHKICRNIAFYCIIQQDALYKSTFQKQVHIFY